MEGGGWEGKGWPIALWPHGSTPANTPTPAPLPQGVLGAVASPTAGAMAVDSSPTF